jgi:hypothetical protein
VKSSLAALVLGAGLLAAAAAPAAAQCVMCKTALAGSPEGRAITADFNHAILLMVAAPYVVMGGFLLGVYRGRLLHDARRLRACLREGWRLGRSVRLWPAPRAGR